MSNVSAASTAKTIPLYPAKAVAAALAEFLLNAVRSTYRRKGLPLPPEDEKLFVLKIEIDSHMVVEALPTLDDIVPFKVTESVVKAGGYDSIESAVKHATGRVEKKWADHHAGVKA